MVRAGLKKRCAGTIVAGATARRRDHEPMPSEDDMIARSVVARVCRTFATGRSTVKHGIVIAGACGAFMAALAIENLVLRTLEVKIKCSSNGLDVATRMPRAEWERSLDAGFVKMDAGSFVVAIPVAYCDSVS